MKNLTSKAVGLFIGFWAFWIFIWIVSTFNLMNNTPEQYSQVTIPSIVIWIIAAIIGSIIISLIVKPIENQFYKIKDLSDKELKNTAKKSLNIHFIAVPVYAIIWTTATFVLFFILTKSFGHLSANSIWVGGIAGIIIVPFMFFVAVPLLFSKTNRAFSAEINRRNLTVNGKFVCIRNKTLLVFTTTCTALVIWVGGFGYYTGINQMIKEIKQSRYDFLNTIEQSFTVNKDSLQDETKILDNFQKLKLANNEIIIVTDNRGFPISDILANSDFELQEANITDFLKIKIKTGNTQSVYDNVTENVFSIKKYGDKYIVFITNINKNIDRLDIFWLWFAIFFVIGLFVATINSAVLSIWLGFSINNLKQLLENLAINDYSKNASKDSEDELETISDKYNIFIRSARKVLSVVQKTSVTLLSTSNQLSTVSEQVSQRAHEQTANTEEVATSMEQMLAMINSNSENAEITRQSSVKSTNEMKQSNKIFVKMINSVSQISEKITIISEIADKIDILSINAAIEAARASETGKGFSVVANEIRKLADKTKIASDEITKLSKTGQDISRIAGKKLETVIPEIIKSTELVNNIVSAGKEQQRGVENINISVQQLTEITSENSASAEEMASSAEELSVQAEHLKKLISVFKIGNLQNKKIIVKQKYGYQF